MGLGLALGIGIGVSFGAGGGEPAIPAYTLTRSSALQTYSATQAGIFSVPTRLLSIEVLSVSGGSATVYANSANSGTAIVTGINTVGKITIPGGYFSFLGLSISITGTISVRLEWETVTAGTTTAPVYSYADDQYTTILVTADRAALRAQPCEVAGFLCYGSSGGSAIIYANDANSGTQIYSGTPTLNAVTDFDPDTLSYLGLSVDVTGTVSLAVQVR